MTRWPDRVGFLNLLTGILAEGQKQVLPSFPCRDTGLSSFPKLPLRKPKFYCFLKQKLRKSPLGAFSLS